MTKALRCTLSRETEVNSVLSEAYELYSHNSYSTTLGRCIRQVCKQMRLKEHNILAKLDGHPAIEYFKEHYDPEAEEQLTLLDCSLTGGA